MHNGLFRPLVSDGEGFHASPRDDTYAPRPDPPRGYTRRRAWAEGCREAVLDRDLSKEEQRSDWGQRPLTKEQIAYAREDASVLLDLYPVLQDEIEQAGLAEVADIEMRSFSRRL